MRQLPVLAGIVALLCSAPMIQAQQSPTQPHRAETMRGANQFMPMMDSLNRRLDSLVDRMNRTGGNQKVAAMAVVINELVAQRKVMQSHMRQMMDGRGGMMHMMNDSSSSSRRVPPSVSDSAASDTAGHAAHHPSE